MDKVEAIKILKDFHDKSALFSVRTALETLHPELAESEDEKMRRELIAYFKNNSVSVKWSGLDVKKAIEWLEKQKYTQKDVDDAYLKGICDAKHELEKQGEQDNWAEELNTKIKELHKQCLEKIQENMPTIVWHSVSEEPEEMKELFCEWESDDATWHDVAFYDKESHTFRHAKMPINVTKWVYVDELLKKQVEQKPIDKVEPRFKVKYAGSEYNVFEVKDIAGVTFYGIEDETNHIDYVRAENCERVDGYSIKENGSPYSTKPAVFSEQNPAWRETLESLRHKWSLGDSTESKYKVEAYDELIEMLKEVNNEQQERH